MATTRMTSKPQASYSFFYFKPSVTDKAISCKIAATDMSSRPRLAREEQLKWVNIIRRLTLPITPERFFNQMSSAAMRCHDQSCSATKSLLPPQPTAVSRSQHIRQAGERLTAGDNRVIAVRHANIAHFSSSHFPSSSRPRPPRYAPTPVTCSIFDDSRQLSHSPSLWQVH